MIEPQIDDFLAEYLSMCKRFGMRIGACGCCESPWVVDKVNDSSLDEHIKDMRDYYEEYGGEDENS